jgi:hypothetical protein
MFNRNKDINSLILMKLDDEDLARICKDPAYKNVCGNDMFWRQRTINRFGSAFEHTFVDSHFSQSSLIEKGQNLQKHIFKGNDESSTDLLEKYSKQYAKNWREYYISLVDFMQHIYKNEKNTLDFYAKNRNDLLTLIQVAKVNKEKIERSIGDKTDEWKSWIREVVVNPNIFELLFDAEEYNAAFENKEELLQYSIEGFKYLLKLDDKRIKPYLLLPIFLSIFPSDHEEITEIISVTLNDPRITVEDIEDTLSDINDNKSANHNVMDQYLDFVSTKLSPQENTRFLRRIISYLRDN